MENINPHSRSSTNLKADFNKDSHRYIIAKQVKDNGKNLEMKWNVKEKKKENS